MKRGIWRFAAISVVCAICCGVFCAGGMICYMAEEEGKTDLPILMYHHILREKSKHGKFVISPEEFEADLRYLKENGYTAITADVLIRYQKGEENLPEKPVMLTFDDGYLSYLEYAVPLLEQYGMCAVVSVVGAYTDTYTQSGDRCVSYAHLNWEDIANLASSTHTEIQNHTYDMHKTTEGRNGCAKKKGEDSGAYQKLFTEDVQKMRNLLYQNTGRNADCFTYPFGYFCREAEQEIKKMGFCMSLSCAEGINRISKNTSLFCLKRFNRAHNRSVQEILEDKCVR